MTLQQVTRTLLSKNFLHLFQFSQALRNFQLEVFVEPKYHPKIIGRKGVIIDRIRKDHEVQIQVPSMKSDEGSDVITLTGYERNCQAAKEEIERMVKELVRSTLLRKG